MFDYLWSGDVRVYVSVNDMALAVSVARSQPQVF